MRRRVSEFVALLTFALLATSSLTQARPSKNLLANPSFSGGRSPKGAPNGWRLYGAQGPNRKLRVVKRDGAKGKALLILDDEDKGEIGITQTVAAKAGEAYRASVLVKSLTPNASGNTYLQMRFAPSQTLHQESLLVKADDAWHTVSVTGRAPAGTKSVSIYLYTHRAPPTRALVANPELIAGVKLTRPTATPSVRGTPPPAPVPPVYTKLKRLHLTTELVAGGKARAVIVVSADGRYAKDAARLRDAIVKRTGIALPIISDVATAVPFKRHLILLGNRSTNRAISKLYDLHYCLLDLKYPGREGYVVRTLHSPFGNGSNAVFIGGSDDVGVSKATTAFLKRLGKARATRGRLALGRLMEIQIGKGIRIPTDLTEFLHWDASAGYRSMGYFGWNSITKRMAMYYMTGDAFHAREAVRLAFPDAKAKREIAKIDGERIENKDDPLAGPYHYNAHLMILYWDLIEESDVFTDAERLRITNAFSRQLNHRKGEGIYTLRGPSRLVGSRHGQWSANSLYCLARYFQKDYPHAIWRHAQQAAQWHFASLGEYVWMRGESDNLFWYNTAIEPTLRYMTLTGDRAPMNSGALAELLMGQEILASGRQPDWALRSGAMGLFNRAAYFTGDGRWVEYRNRTGVDTNVFRLGQSYWPEETLTPKPPKDLVGKWSVLGLSEPAWRARRNGFLIEESFQFGSFRSAPDASGDFILIDGYNGASRNPYHTFAILQLRIAGHPLLKGYLNQVLTRADGLVEPKVAMNAALRHRDVIGKTALAVGEVPNAAYCNWRRTLAQRTGRYALVVDEITPRVTVDNLDVQFLWEPAPGLRRQARGRIDFVLSMGDAKGQKWVRAMDNTCTTNLRRERPIARLGSLDTVLLRAPKPGPHLDMTFELARTVKGEAAVRFVCYTDRGIVQILLDDKRVGKSRDLYSPYVRQIDVPLGTVSLRAGKHTLRIKTVGKSRAASSCYAALSGLVIAEAGAPPPARGVILSADPMGVARRRASVMHWTGKAHKGRARTVVSLVGVETAGTPPLACARLAENAVALNLPEPAIAVTGKYAGTKATLAVIAADHAFARQATAVALDRRVLLSANGPVDVDWDFRSGELCVVATRTTKLRLSAMPDANATLDGKPVRLPLTSSGSVRIPKGKHQLSGVRPPKKMRAALATDLGRRMKTARTAWDREVARLATAREEAVRELKPVRTHEIGDAVADLIAVERKGGPMICAAAANRVRVIDGKRRLTLKADGEVRMIHWWPEHELLLAGCADEKVIAFDMKGARKWVFTSVMDPEVFRRAKTYWFKSDPRHRGVHGLSSGVFLNGKSQAFVGSACTVEIIDGRGKLVKRLPCFWGDASTFRLVPKADGSVNLLVARKTNGVDTVAMINSRTLDARKRGFHGVPSGHTRVGGWSAQNRHHLLHVDLDGDGKKEVVSETNGTWNRVTVYDEQGKPRHNVNFGPGRRIPTLTMRDLVVTDLNGNGKKEIVAATSSGMVVALDRNCHKVWATRLHGAPVVLAAVRRRRSHRPWLVAACQDRTLRVLDGSGKLVRSARLPGRPTRMVVAGPGVIFVGTDAGKLVEFALK